MWNLRVSRQCEVSALSRSSTNTAQVYMVRDILFNILNNSFQFCLFSQFIFYSSTVTTRSQCLRPYYYLSMHRGEWFLLNVPNI